MPGNAPNELNALPPSLDRCARCGAPPGPLEIGGADARGWVCDACLDRAGLLELVPLASEVERLILAAERAVASPDALADPAELMLRGKLP